MVIFKERNSKEKSQLMKEFDLAITCKHGNKAPWCGICQGKDWLAAITASGKTVEEVVEEFVSRGIIERIELEEYLMAKKRRRKIKEVAAVAGLVVVGGFLLYEGGKIILRLISQEKKSQKKG